MDTRNWVADVHGLPSYIKRVAKHLMEQGADESTAIAEAVSQVKKWALTSKDPKVKAKAAAAIAEWEKKKLQAHADNKGRGSEMDWEIRSVGGEVRPEGDPDKRLFAARVLNYNKVDDHGTSWAPGVFTESLQRKLPKAVWSHDKDRPIGKVVEYRDSDEGLDVIVQLAEFDAVPDSRMAHSLLKDEIIDEFSFAFRAQEHEPDPTHKGVRRFTKAQMFEVSPVLVGSGQDTKLHGVRSAASTSRAEATAILEKVANGELSARDALDTLAILGTRSVEDAIELVNELSEEDARALAEDEPVETPKESFDAELRAIDDLLEGDWS